MSQGVVEVWRCVVHSRSRGAAEQVGQCGSVDRGLRVEGLAGDSLDT
jgi:hypothetical protein